MWARRSPHIAEAVASSSSASPASISPLFTSARPLPESASICPSRLADLRRPLVGLVEQFHGTGEIATEQRSDRLEQRELGVLRRLRGVLEEPLGVREPAACDREGPAASLSHESTRARRAAPSLSFSALYREYACSRWAIACSSFPLHQAASPNSS